MQLVSALLVGVPGCSACVVCMSMSCTWKRCHSVYMLANLMLTVSHGAHVRNTVRASPVRLVGRQQHLLTHHAFAIISVRWSWVGLHTLACQVSLPTTCKRAAHIEKDTDRQTDRHTHTHTHTERERERETIR